MWEDELFDPELFTSPGNWADGNPTSGYWMQAADGTMIYVFDPSIFDSLIFQTGGWGSPAAPNTLWTPQE